MRTGLSIVALLVALAACDADPVETAAAQAVVVQPSLNGDLVFSRSYDAVVEAAFVNVSERTVYFAMPDYNVLLERQEAEGWVAIPAWYGIISITPYPLPIASGSYRPLIEIPLTDQSLNVEPGTYRVQVLVYEDAEWTRLLPEPERVSVPFEVVE